MGAPFSIAYTEAALTSLKLVEPKKIRAQIVKKIAALGDDPKPSGCCKVMGASTASREVYRIRQGDFRVLYCQNGDSEILVLDVGHRKDVYR